MYANARRTRPQGCRKQATPATAAKVPRMAGVRLAGTRQVAAKMLARARS